jgi:hypothetical protein
MNFEEEAFLRVQAVHHAGLKMCLVTLEEERAEVKRLREALELIAYSSSDCPPGEEPESFYYSQMTKSIGTAARAIRRYSKE